MARKAATGAGAAAPVAAAPYGTHQCPDCGAQVERAYPGYAPAEVLDLHCAACGGYFTPSAETLAG